jgi:hypothetical protein
MNMKVRRVLVYVCTFAFIYMTIEIVRADPERRLLVLWILAGAAVVATCVATSRGVRTEEREDDDSSVVSLVERIRRDR